jgi:hypothetical protein
LPINYLWHPEQNVNWARGLFFREQHVVPGGAYLVAYLVLVPLCVFFPTHLFLESISRRWKGRADAENRPQPLPG